MRRFILVFSGLSLLIGCASQGTNGGSASEDAAAFRGSVERWEREDAYGSFARAVRAADDAALRLFALSEAEYAALPEEARDERLEAYLAFGEVYRRFSREVIGEAMRLAEAGRAQDAAALLEALERVARANDSEDLVRFSRLISDAVLEDVRVAQAELSE